MKTFKRIFYILRKTKALNIFISFIILSIIGSFIFILVEPDIHNIRDGLWYCFVSSTTIGFGDIYATTTIGRILTIIISFYGIFVFAIMTGSVVSYYNEYLNAKHKETVSLFLEKLEDLPNLSKKELQDISDKVKKIK